MEKAEELFEKKQGYMELPEMLRDLSEQMERGDFTASSGAVLRTVLLRAVEAHLFAMRPGRPALAVRLDAKARIESSAARAQAATTDKTAALVAKHGGQQ